MGENSQGQGSIATPSDILVGKWKPVILYQLIQHRTLCFSELQQLIPDITKEMLTEQLGELEYHGIIHREIHPVVPPKVEYSLTEYSVTLIPLLISMQEWGNHDLEETNDTTSNNVNDRKNVLALK